MSFWSFIGELFKRVFYSGWKFGDVVDRVLVYSSPLIGYLTGQAAGHGGPKVLIAFPLGAFLLAVVASLIIHAYRLYREEFLERKRLEEWVTPKLEFAGIGARTHNIYRVRIRNLSSQSIWFKATLMEISPPINITTPIALQATNRHGEEGEVIGGEYGTADVFVDHKTSLRLLPGVPVGAPEFKRNDRYELVICVSCRDCPPIYRRYYIVPQGEEIILTDGGEYRPPGRPVVQTASA